MAPILDGLQRFISRMLSAVDRGFEFLMAPPRSPNAKAFQVSALFGRAIMNTRMGPFISRTGRSVYPLALAVLAPAVPKRISQIVARTITASPFIFWFVITQGFCLGLNAIFSCNAGTFSPPAGLFAAVCAPDSAVPPEFGRRLYFTQDIYNILLYAAVVPAYVAFDITIIKLFVTTWPDFKSLADNAIQPTAASSDKSTPASSTINRRLAFFFIVVGLIVVFFITDYINDILRPASLVKPVYWFVRVTQGGDRVLNSVGAYYLIMNAVLLFLTVSALWCYFAISSEIARYAKNLLKKPDDSAEAVLKQHSDVLLFNKALIFMKILVFLYALNIFIWAKSPLAAVQNALVALIALLLVMTICIPVPRIYLEYRWHALNSFADEGYVDIRSTRERWTTRIMDAGVLLMLIEVARQRYGLDKIYESIVAPLYYIWDSILRIFPAT